jgi:methylenetetrahydrofolate dehydrogenase (NADP+) / methenyltetrahydrofolate cyclohydrolase
METKIIDGKAIAAAIRGDIALQVQGLKNAGIAPGLAVIVVGNDPASAIYVRNKLRACAEVGMRSFKYEFASTATEKEILALIADLNMRDDVHGILIQLPLPPHISVRHVLAAISVDKDVDGFHLYNVGGLITGHTVFPPCTPYGVVKLLEHEKIAVEGKNVVIVGASNIVGKPMALMLMQRDATVCICHAKTRDLAQFTLLADILVVAAGKPNLILPQMVKTGAAVIDVGINRLPNGKLVGDTDFNGLLGKVSHITPVPGGVGPMTVTMLLANTVGSASRLLSSAKAGQEAPAY